MSEKPESSEPVSPAPAPAPTGDRALVVGAAPDGSALEVLRQRAEGAPVEAGVVRPLQDGQPIVGEVVRLKPRQETPLLCDVEVALASPRAATASPRKGPAKVNSSAYKDGWERVFTRPEPGLLN